MVDTMSERYYVLHMICIIEGMSERWYVGRRYIYMVEMVNRAYDIYGR